MAPVWDSYILVSPFMQHERVSKFSPLKNNGKRVVNQHLRQICGGKEARRGLAKRCLCTNGGMASSYHASAGIAGKEMLPTVLHNRCRHAARDRSTQAYSLLCVETTQVTARRSPQPPRFFVFSLSVLPAFSTRPRKGKPPRRGRRGFGRVGVGSMGSPPG